MPADRRIGDNNHLQLRLPRELRAEIGEIAERMGVSFNDVIRGALHFGLPVFAAMFGIQDEMVRRLVRTLKAHSRGKRKKRKPLRSQ